MDETLDISAKGQLRAGILPQAENEEEQKKILSFLDRLTEEQAAQLLALDGYTEEYKIPIWDADLDGPGAVLPLVDDDGLEGDNHDAYF